MDLFTIEVLELFSGLSQMILMLLSVNLCLDQLFIQSFDTFTFGFELCFFEDESFAELVELLVFRTTIGKESVQLLSFEKIVLFQPSMIFFQSMNFMFECLIELL